MTKQNDKTKNGLFKPFKNRKFGVITITALLRPFLNIRLKEQQNVDEADFPVIFVCNHGEIYGPLSAVVGMPYDFRPWINGPLLSKDTAYDFVYENTMVHNKLPEATKIVACETVRHLGTWALNSYNPIPVSKSSLSELKNTLNMSVDALVQGDNLLIFPENPENEPDRRYNTEGISAFSSGFAHIAKCYYRKTGKALTFYPIYSDKHTRTLTFGNAVKYNPNAPATEEKQRLVNEISQSMNKMMLAAKHEMKNRREKSTSTTNKTHKPDNNKLQ